MNSEERRNKKLNIQQLVFMCYTRKKSEDYCSDYADKIIDEIYDDFESRTCDNCKYINKEHDEMNECGHPIDEMLYISTVPKNFSCNKWEKKND